MKIDRKNFRWLALLIVFGIAVNWAFTNPKTVSQGLSFVWHLLSPFIVGFIIAFICNIPMQFFQKKVFRAMSPKKAKYMSFVCIIMIALLVIAFFAFVLIPQLVQSIVSLAQSIPEKLQILQKEIAADQNIVPLVKEKLSTITIDWEKISKEILPKIQQNTGGLLTSAFSAAGSAVQAVVNFFISLSLAIYLLMNWESAKAACANIVNAYMPDKMKAPADKLATVSNRIFHHFITVQCLECVIIAALFSIGLLIAGIKYWLIFSVMIGILSIIPRFGSFFGLFISLIIVFIEQGGVKVLIFIAIFIVIDQINENLIYSKLVSNSMGIPEIGIMIAGIFGGAFFGAMGTILFIPIFGIIYTLFREGTQERLRKKNIAVQKSSIPGEDDLI